MSKLPKLYRPVTIKFDSLRNRLGDSMGVVFDGDCKVVRKVMRVVLSDGNWTWQLCDFNRDCDWDYDLYQDREILEAYGQNLEYELI